MTLFGMQIPRWALRVAQLAMAAALLAFLWRAADGPAAARSLASAEWPWLAAAFLALTLQTLLSALRWRLTAAQLGISLGRGHAVREYYLAQVVNQSLPGGMIGDAGRALRARGQAGLLASGLAVAFERLAGQVAMFLAMTAAFIATIAMPGGLEWPRWLAVPVALLILGGAASPIVLLGAARLPGAVGRSAASFWRKLHLALAARGVLSRQVALSVGTTVCILGAFAFCAEAVGVRLELSEVLGLVPIILFTMLIPLTVSGWGLREGAAAALFPLAGASASAGLAASVAFGLVFIVTVLPGLLFLSRKPVADVVKPW
ncbi:lysylphosphatidylglycerol synthase transmembrane domain-containing protein [Roseibacterium sp. SDUM158017]|nr:lysylphosphatidylglycerol synthase transmembrane domain-containing protein [Roseibacterium sp. SDUM158017]